MTAADIICSFLPSLPSLRHEHFLLKHSLISPGRRLSPQLTLPRFLYSHPWHGMAARLCFCICGRHFTPLLPLLLPHLPLYHTPRPSALPLTAHLFPTTHCTLSHTSPLPLLLLLHPTHTHTPSSPCIHPYMAAEHHAVCLLLLGTGHACPFPFSFSGRTPRTRQVRQDRWRWRWNGLEWWSRDAHAEPEQAGRDRRGMPGCCRCTCRLAPWHLWLEQTWNRTDRNRTGLRPGGGDRPGGLQA